MEASRLADRARRRLARTLEEPGVEPLRRIERMRAWGENEGVAPFAHAARVLFHLELEDDDARRLIERVLVHRVALAEALGRDPGLAVAAADFLVNVERRIQQPTLVEMDAWERTSRSARTDALTGLANRSAFLEALDLEIRRSRRYGLTLAVVLLDLDGFKGVNDRHGHLLGDVVLERVGRLLRRTAREADTTGRLGGDEFALLLPEAPRLGAFAAAERVRKAVRRAFESEIIDGAALAVTLSGGIASWPEDGAYAQDLLQRADAALYRAKHGGRDRIVLHHLERRAEVRWPARPGTFVAWSRTGASAWSRARVVDLSSRGALLEDDGMAPPPARIDLAFERRGSDERHLGARVVREERGAGAGSARRAGVFFDAPLPADLLRDRRASNVSPARETPGASR